MSGVKIEEGKFYRTRDGQKVGPMRRTEPKDSFGRGWNWTTNEHAKLLNGAWRDDGAYDAGDARVAVGNDLVAEWTDEPTGPVRTRTVTEIVPGVYGRVEVVGQSRFENEARIRIAYRDGEEAGGEPVNRMTAGELRAAAATFTQLADAMEGGAS